MHTFLLRPPGAWRQLVHLAGWLRWFHATGRVTVGSPDVARGTWPEAWRLARRYARLDCPAPILAKRSTLPF